MTDLCIYPWQHEKGCQCVLRKLAADAGFGIVYSTSGITRITGDELSLQKFAQSILALESQS